ncbi:MAG: hypothetical protein ACJASV_000064 [Pseudorhodobacter sp.]|jgi:hypothetical protein
MEEIYPIVKVRGIEFQANTDNDMGIEFHNLSHALGFKTQIGHTSKTRRLSEFTIWQNQVC